MEQLLTIGEFAERCGLSRSALRFYDQNDLLRPQLVDEETGYRYYAVGQPAQALLVRRLRAAEMPVGVVRRYLAAAPDQRRAVLELHLGSFRERASVVERAVEELRCGLVGGDGEGRGQCCRVAPAQFAQALARVSFAIADPSVREELGAVWVETRDASLWLVATDSYRLAVRDLVPDDLGAGGLRGVIDAEQATVLTGELAGARTFVLCHDAGGAITATVAGRRGTVGHAGEGFPDCERILTGLPAGNHMAVAREAITGALAELTPDAPQLRLDFRAEQLVLSASDGRATVAGSWSGSPLCVLPDGRFVAEAVAATVGPDLVIEGSDPLHPVTLRSADTGTFCVLTMPVSAPKGELARLRRSPAGTRPGRHILERVRSSDRLRVWMSSAASRAI